ncbi:MAG TPA: adenine phosphoribosyltransferase [Balneolales bacterium]|nr:adenine phosphoribosyltransferase [Balneolales bacterium]
MKKVENEIKNYIKKNIRNIPDFPKPGIQFKDITPILSDKDALELTSWLLARPYEDNHVDVVVGLEARGFLFGTNLAMNLNAGFVPIRKPNKLPADTLSISYDLEYGVDSLEIHNDSISKGDKVIIHDDLIATGGSAVAAYELINKLGGEVIGFSFIIGLNELNGKSNLPSDVPVDILIEI